MWRVLKNRLRQGHRTAAWPDGPAGLPERFRGRPKLRPELCRAGCTACAEACPTAAITTAPLTLDLGRCLFCAECVEACPEGALVHLNEHRMAAGRREDLVLTGAEQRLAGALEESARRLFGRSLKLRAVSAGSCGGCEAELTALGNVVFDLGRFGVQFVASPRHADGLVVTGALTRNMTEALRLSYEAVPAPKLVIAVGACAVSGGPFAGSPQVLDGAGALLPVDFWIPGCPPHPLTVLDGLLRLLGRLS